MKALICINSCKRLHLFKAFVWPIIIFAEAEPDFDFVLSLDGKDSRYITFCKKYGIPIIYSDEQEGIGIAKNRVLELFPQYDYYFFLDDDVEVLETSVFKEVIKLANKNHIPHISLGRNERFTEIQSIAYFEETEVVFSDFGHGAFSFFTKEGLNKVGGFHTEFAKFKRFGHTEHSYRFLNSGLQKSPFINIPELSNCFIWHEPSSVTKSNVSLSNHYIAEPEVEIMNLKLNYFPVTTLSKFYLENFGEKVIFNKLKRASKLSRLIISLNYKLGLFN